ncbi:Isopentenyl-diphosphate delta-isomerase [Brevibacillus laterosporus]|nr:type 2 isopentenyl-diphosphate Delta-isomerase [Brevibacillus laterosporus]MBM7110626.1 Isopentenyl-diphosphate delta-isomerase [Brevibacillus laterosporus]
MTCRKVIVVTHQSEIEKRKSEHIEICLHKEVANRLTTGLEQYHFLHAALPEIHFADVSLHTTFLGKHMGTPFLVSSMTGGTKNAEQINTKLAIAAEARGWAMGLGSVRAALESDELAQTFRVREHAPTIPIIANLGAVQLNYGYTVKECLRCVELVEADTLVLHVNSMQEIFQPGGDHDFGHLLPKIEQVCKASQIPIGVKEVGFGIDSQTARRLVDAGVSFIDVAGAGGTSWIEVEKHRSNETMKQIATEAFRDWGIPTAVSLQTIREELPFFPLIGSGGIHNGVEAAKAIALGADLVGFGRALLEAATTSVEEVVALMERVEFECRAAMFGIGVATIEGLSATDRLWSIGELKINRGKR